MTIIIAFVFSNLLKAEYPYELKTDRELIIGGTTVALGISSLLMNESITPHTEKSISELNKSLINGFDRWITEFYSPQHSDFSDILLVGLAAAPAAMLLSNDFRSEFLSYGILYAQTMASAAVLPYLAKAIFQRSRPFVYNPDVPYESKSGKDAKRSFFSGHSTVAFASMVFLAKVYSDAEPNSIYKPYITAGALFLASAVSGLRLSSGMHFPTDVLAGALVGSALGFLMPELQKKKPSKGPVLQSGLFHLSFRWDF